jgi:hypothetical protein
MNRWPMQADCNRFYGNPRGTNGGPSAAWESANLVSVKPPYRMTYAGKPVSGIRIHRKCAESLKRVLARIWDAAGRDQATVDRWGASIYGGAYNYRLMRGGNALSMHSWGCAIDLDPARNGLGDQTPHFANVPEVLEAFAAEGWEWGGDWSRRDGMHWQAAWTRARPARVGTSAPLRLVAEVLELPAPEPDSVVAPAAVLLTAAEIIANKERLRAKGYAMVGEPDDDIGARTVAAIAAFQKVNGLPITSEFDEATRKALSNGGKEMTVAPARANASEAEIAAKVPEVAAARKTGFMGVISAVLTGVGVVVSVVKDYAAQAIEIIRPVKEVIDDVPGEVWALAVGGMAFAMWWQSRTTAVTAADAYRKGERT